MKSPEMSRREFLKLAAAGALAGSLSVACGPFGEDSNTRQTIPTNPDGTINFSNLSADQQRLFGRRENEVNILLPQMLQLEKLSGLLLTPITYGKSTDFTSWELWSTQQEKEERDSRSERIASFGLGRNIESDELGYIKMYGGLWREIGEIEREQYGVTDSQHSKLTPEESEKVLVQTLNSFFKLPENFSYNFNIVESVGSQSDSKTPTIFVDTVLPSKRPLTIQAEINGPFWYTLTNLSG